MHLAHGCSPLHRSLRRLQVSHAAATRRRFGGFSSDTSIGLNLVSGTQGWNCLSSYAQSVGKWSIGCGEVGPMSGASEVNSDFIPKRDDVAVFQRTVSGVYCSPQTAWGQSKFLDPKVFELHQGPGAQSI